jgi:histidinol-phosphate aminotransferase
VVRPHSASHQLYELASNPEEVRSRYGLSRVARLASNENPLGVSPLALAGMRTALDQTHRYPDGGLALRRKLAERFHVKVENVIAGAGSEGIMANVFRAFLGDQDEILTTEAAFLGFQVLARNSGVPYRTVPYRDWRYDLPQIADAVGERTKLIYLANPNNPTGTVFTRDEFDEFYRRVPKRVLILLDEAYFEFVEDRAAFPDSMQYRYDNVVTLRTFSKAYGLAGARIGYGFAHEDLIKVLLKTKLPFEPNSLAEAAALGALDDEEFLAHTLESNRRGLKFLVENLRELGLMPVPSQANFVLLPLESDAQAAWVFEELLKKGVIVRPMRAAGLPHCLRFSVGLPQDNQQAIEALAAILKGRDATKH